MTSPSLSGLRIVVSAGPTYEDLDPVRFIGNRSSGKMGFAIAAAAARRGADTSLVAGPVQLSTPQGVHRRDVRSAAQLRDAVLAGLTLDTFNRHADKIAMANVAQLINSLHSLFLAHEDKFILTPTFHVFEMFLPHMGGQAVRALFSAPEVRYTRVDKPAEFWGLKGSASVNSKQLTLTVTNPHVSETRQAEIVVRGARAISAQARVLATSDVHAHNTFENPRVVEPRDEQVTINASAISFRFPPASVTRLQIGLV